MGIQTKFWITLVVAAILGLAYWHYEVLKKRVWEAQQEVAVWQQLHIQSQMNDEFKEQERLRLERISEALRTDLKTLKANQKTRVEYVKVYYDNPTVGKCGTSGEWVYQYDNAVLLSDNKPFTLGADPVREQSFDDQVSLGVAIHNLGEYHELERRFLKLREACTTAIDNFNSRVKEYNSQTAKGQR